MLIILVTGVFAGIGSLADSTGFGQAPSADGRVGIAGALPARGEIDDAGVLIGAV
ncbi:hypothetical protein [Nocardia cyriacigeorgica]|uniref:hypothetical protein n=1 Tax=Nocardia cyriacigeorgica TaxID=135487 RepID=UPI0018958ED1|nr:hypothetical protein [Nocardia cyriacigeorgica]MBF6285290.1 hypothetical protein [Nocardia cyriacigeorgica]